MLPLKAPVMIIEIIWIQKDLNFVLFQNGYDDGDGEDDEETDDGDDDEENVTSRLYSVGLDFLE